MKTAGGIVAIIAGVISIFAAITTLLIGGVGANSTVVALGWGGVFFSFLVVVLGAVCLGSRSKTPGTLLIVSSIAGAVLGGTLVALFMVLALIGGILAVVGTKPQPALAGSDAGIVVSSTPAKQSRPLLYLSLVLGAVVIGGVVFSVAGMALFAKIANAPTSTSARQTAANAAPTAFEIGDTFRSHSFEMTVTSAKATTTVGTSLFATHPADGGIFVAVQYAYKNISTKPVTLFEHPSIYLVSPDGTEYRPDIAASSAYATEGGSNSKLLSDLNPGIRATDESVFEVSRQAFDPAKWQIVLKADNQIARVRFNTQPPHG